MELKVRVQMSRYNGSREGWSIRVTDDESGIMVCELDLTDAEMGQALGSLSIAPKEPADIAQSPNIGKRAENFSCVIPLTRADWDAGAESVRKRALEALSEQQRDAGWTPDGYTCKSFNHHNVQGEDGYRMIYRRFVSVVPHEERPQ